MVTLDDVLSALLGVALGDAVGVPFEFRSRQAMQEQPATDMVGYGTYHQPAGTWSDDASLTFCLAEALIQGYDLPSIAQNFVRWRHENYWTARGEVFDIGITTAKAIERLKRLLEEKQYDELRQQTTIQNENENGNGSLMRILPLLFYIQSKPIEEQFEIIQEVSALTHRHIRAAMSCLIYLKMAEHLLAKKSKLEAYAAMRSEIMAFWEQTNFSADERKHFAKLIQNDIREVPIEQMLTGGYVIEVLESSFWFFLQKETYAETVLGIINLGHDTDTAAAIAGGLAGLYYGTKGIPTDWREELARKDDIEDLAKRLYQGLY
jgi:ADP-ribosyl-[dinitrogen reductase] hydrolase